MVSLMLQSERIEMLIEPFVTPVIERREHKNGKVQYQSEPTAREVYSQKAVPQTVYWFERGGFWFQNVCLASS